MLHAETARQGIPQPSDVEMTSLSEEGGGRGGLLSRDDCLCPICLEIFLEPVTLPCDHTFCKPCFLETVDKAALCCPMCRKRVSTWARLNARKKTLVNDQLWRQVQAAFPLQCQRRLIGQEGGGEEDQVFVSTPKVCPPGEVRREYEDQIIKLAEERRALEEAEWRASEEYIQQLLAEEEEQMTEERRRQEERQLEDDEKLARLLSQQLNSSPMSDFPGNVSSAEVTPAKRRQKSVSGDIERFLCAVQPELSSSDSNPISTFMANKQENIVDSQIRPWAYQTEPADCPMPVLEYYGRLLCPVPPPLPASPPRVLPVSSLAGKAKPHPVCTQAHPYTEGALSGKRKSSEMSQEEPDVTKHVAFSSVLLKQVAGGMQELAQREEEFFTRLQQEEEDRRLALLLQEELDKKQVQRATDRSKESSNPYQLRQKSSTGAQPGPSTADQGPSSKPAKACSSSSTAKKTKAEQRLSFKKKTLNSSISSPVMKSCKQATLTEMFPRQGGMTPFLPGKRDK